LQGQGKLREAVESYDQAFQIKPDYADACDNRGIALKDFGQLKGIRGIIASGAISGYPTGSFFELASFPYPTFPI
jgi:tetratricopeptide repeat protein